MTDSSNKAMYEDGLRFGAYSRTASWMSHYPRVFETRLKSFPIDANIAPHATFSFWNFAVCIK